MGWDLATAGTFVATHARLLDRLRFGLLTGTDSSDQVLAALAAYRNPDGGYGWGLEPDLRDASSQPVGAMHALEVLVEAATEPLDLSLFDWLTAHTLADGGLPFALPISDRTGCAPHWLAADPSVSTLQMTSQVAAQAHLLARRFPAVAEQPWLAHATDYCLAAIRAIDTTPHAYELSFSLKFLDSLGPAVDKTLLDRLGGYLSPDGSMEVAGGSAGERLRALDFSPLPGAPSRRLFSADDIAADLARLTTLQQDDGGWPVEFASASPAAALEWRGYATVQAVQVLRANT